MKKYAVIVLVVLFVLLSGIAVYGACSSTGDTNYNCGGCPDGSGNCLKCCTKSCDNSGDGNNGGKSGNVVANPTFNPTGMATDCSWDPKSCSDIDSANCGLCGCGSGGNSTNNTEFQESATDPDWNGCVVKVIDFREELGKNFDPECITTMKIKTATYDDIGEIYYVDKDGKLVSLNKDTEFDCHGYICGYYVEGSDDFKGLCHDCAFLDEEDDWCKTCEDCNNGPFGRCGSMSDEKCFNCFHNSDRKKPSDVSGTDGHDCERCFNEDNSNIPVCKSYTSTDVNIATSINKDLLADAKFKEAFFMSEPKETTIPLTCDGGNFINTVPATVKPGDIVIKAQNKCYKTDASVTLKTEIGYVVPNLAGKAQICKAGNLVPACGWADDGDGVFEPATEWPPPTEYCQHFKYKWNPLTWKGGAENGKVKVACFNPKGVATCFADGPKVTCIHDYFFDDATGGSWDDGLCPYGTENNQAVWPWQPEETVLTCEGWCMCPTPCWDCDIMDTKKCVDKNYNPHSRSPTMFPAGNWVAGVFGCGTQCKECRPLGNVAEGDYRVAYFGKDLGDIEYRINTTEYYCNYGCRDGACLNSTPPILRSISANPLLSRINGTVLVTSVGYDPDTIYDLNGTINYKEPIRLVCSSNRSINGSGVDSGGGIIIDPITGEIIIPGTMNITNATYVPDLCVGSFSFSNPNCTITIPGTFTDGDHEIFCRIRDRNGTLSTTEKSAVIKIDNKPPNVMIISPPDLSVQVKNFLVGVNDTDENGMNYCQFNITSNGVSINWTNRTCNTKFTVTVGAGKMCAMGDCAVTVIGFDKAGNNRTDTRTYSANYVFSNITSPETGTWQRRDFLAYATDIDYSGGKIVKCLYRTRNTTNTTRDWTERLCNDLFNVSVGPGEDCNMQSTQNESTCIVDVRAVNNESINGSATNVYYKIDWETPTSNITAPGIENWLNDDFDVSVEDVDYFGIGFRNCEYEVIVNGDVTKYWSDRLCNSSFKVYVGDDGDCNIEGAGTCTVKARAIGASGNIGVEDERNYSVILSDVDDLDGFSQNEYYQTDTGVSFMGALKRTLSVPIFRVCNKGFTIAECENSFTISSQDCGIDKPCLCGSNSETTCAINCADMESQYYLLATGMDMSTYANAKVISPPKIFACPFMNISGLNTITTFFRNLDQTFSVQIMQLDYLIRNTNNTNQSDAWKKQMGRYIDARLLARQHIKYMEGVIADPSVTRSLEAFNQTEIVKQQILEILNAVDYVPTAITISANIASNYRIYTNVSVPAIIEKFGNRTVYAKLACTINKPNGQNIILNSSCMAEPYPSFSIEFAADQIGDWNILCVLDGSTRSDCDGSIEYQSYTKTFRVMPFEEPKITRITLPTNVMNSSKANVIVETVSPEQSGLYGKAVCIFKDPGGTTYEGTSICVSIPKDVNTSLNTGVNVRKIGTWNVSKCTLNAATRSDCVGAYQTDEKLDVGAFEVIVPSNLYISSVNVPGEVISGTKAGVGVSVLNPVDDRYAKVACTITGPGGAVSLGSECVPITSGNGYTFTMTFTPEQEGTWNVASCSVNAAASSDCADSVTQHTVTDAASFNVIKGRNLTVRNINYQGVVKINTTQLINFQVRNPTDVDRFGYVICALTKSNSQPVSNKTACTKFMHGASTEMKLGYFTNIPGTWSVDSCVVYGSMWSDCNGATLHGSQYGLGTFDVVTELKSYIEYRRLVETTIFIENPIEVMSDVRNPDNDIKYLYVTCAFKDPQNKTYYNSSECQRFEGTEKRTVYTDFMANLTGKWFVTECALNVTSEAGCFNARTHNSTANIGQVDVRTPFVKIMSVTPPSSGLQVGDEAIIYVDVRNYVSYNVTAFVNCTLKSPNNTTYNLTSGIQKVPKGETKTFTLSKIVNAEGDWLLTKCSVYKIMSPATLEHQISGDWLFSVLSPRPRECTLDTDCPGTDERCYCAQNTCNSCSSGERCSNNACVQYQPQCITDADCPAGHKCESDTCIRMGDCTYDTDCPTGYKCESYNCKKIGQCTDDYECESGYTCFNYRCEKVQKPILDQNAILFIIIIIVVLIVPFIIFSYMKRTI